VSVRDPRVEAHDKVSYVSLNTLDSDSALPLHEYRVCTPEVPRSAPFALFSL